MYVMVLHRVQLPSVDKIPSELGDQHIFRGASFSFAVCETWPQYDLNNPFFPFSRVQSTAD